MLQKKMTDNTSDKVNLVLIWKSAFVIVAITTPKINDYKRRR
jgi:hypothetical protein